MILVYFYGKYDVALYINASSVVEAHFIVQEWINSQKVDKNGDTLIQIQIHHKSFRLESHFEIDMNNFKFQDFKG